MLDLLRNLFSSGNYMPHVHCYLYTPGLIWLHVVSDALIGLSYVAISGTLIHLVTRGRGSIPFHSMFVAFGVFIIACGATHFFEIWTLWNATYWLSGAVKAITAIASVTTAIALPPMIPLTLRMVRDAHASERNRRELEAAHEELNALYGKLKEFDELKTQFFANVSHELRTPLALILGPAEKLAADGDLTERQRQDLDVIGRNARTLLKHVNDLLDISRLDAGRMGLRYAEADLPHLVRLTAAHFEALAEERDIKLAVEAPGTLAAEVDPEKLQRVLLNLLSNAFKFSPAGGTVRCSVQTLSGAADDGAANARVAIAVADTGPGVPEELRESIFERFRQGDGGTARRFGGTGLGLAIARDFVELHRGRVTVGDTPEGGALFTVELPLLAPAGEPVNRSLPAADESGEAARQATESLRAGAGAPMAAEGSEGLAARPLVLVVEDNPEMNRFIVESLSGEHRTVTAFDGREGLDRALELQPDLILTDLMMAGMGGDQLVREARSHPELDAIPIVVLTAKADDDLRTRLLREGAQDYVMKPFSVEELRARVGNQVRMKRARDVLQQEVESQLSNLDDLAREVAHSKRELQATLETLQLALEHAEQAGQVKSTFLRMVSHELRTPLTALQLQLELLRRTHRPEFGARQQEIIGRMASSSSRLLELIESLLEYSRIESGRLSVDPEPLDLTALVAATVDELRPLAEQQGLQLYALPPQGETAEASVPLLQSDPRLVRLILVNLTMNAVKFAEQGAIEVEVTYREGAHRLAVRDYGPGIPHEQQAVIFEPFEQLQGVAHKHQAGVGLGLALVREMTQALGAHVELQSEVGTGSTFTVVFPTTV